MFKYESGPTGETFGVPGDTWDDQILEKMEFKDKFSKYWNTVSSKNMNARDLTYGSFESPLATAYLVQYT